MERIPLRPRVLLTRTEETRVKVLRASVVEGRGVPGPILDDSLTIACGGDAVRLLDGSNELVRQDVSLESFDESVFLIGVVSSDPALLNSLDAQQIAGFSSTRVRHIAADGLPEVKSQSFVLEVP